MTRYNLGEYGDHVFIFDKTGEKLLRKFWFLSDGSVSYREWNKDGNETTDGQKSLLGRIQ